MLNLFAECRTDGGCTPALISWDVPHPHWEGLLHFRQCLDRVKRLHREEEDAKREAERKRGAVNG